MAHRDILAIGTSAGGFEALRFLASRFPPDFPASVLVTIHLPSHFQSHLDMLLSKSGPLPASFARDGETPKSGRIYIATPERHLLVLGNKLHLGHGPRENFARPAIDPMFRSVAACCAERAIGVVLTGSLGDGSAGLHVLKQAGGITVVQDPADAAFPEMPRRAMTRATPDHVIGLAEMPMLLAELVREPIGKGAPVPEITQYEVDVARGGRANMDDMDRLGRRSVLACPDCHGIMWEIDEGNVVRFRCHLGHAYTAELMSVALDENLRRALGSALRSLEERVALMHKLHQQARSRKTPKLAEMWGHRAEEYEQEANVVRESIRRVDALASQPVEDQAAE